ncbi:hypothetical protein [Gaopeijia maritima]|uniref:Uncharacterized protein n=1 Tax=Gaopeijia maritima TaxID=3119007 RepID=A0ABU9EBZ1_9BACT
MIKMVAVIIISAGVGVSFSPPVESREGGREVSLASHALGEVRVVDEQLFAGVVLSTTAAPNLVDCERCLQPGECEVAEHVFLAVPEELEVDQANGESQHNYCKEGWCSEEHSSEGCEGGEPDSEASLSIDTRIELWERYAAGDLQAVARMVSEAEGVVLNEERMSVQGFGCNGAIVLNLPLSAAQLDWILAQ